MSFPIRKIIIHCSATPNGKAFTATDIDRWHKARGFKRNPHAVKSFNIHLPHIGYHFVINLDGTIETGRQIGEIGAHCKGHNQNSIGICLIGGISASGKNHAKFSEAQWEALARLMRELASQYPNADIYGHRDLSPDLNGDGTITPNEWIKTCPNFDVTEWLDRGETVFVEHLYKEKK